MTSKFWIGTLACTLLLTSCDDSATEKRINDFNTALVQSSAAMKDYYLQLNDLERDAYFDELRFSPGRKMSETKPGALVAPDPANPSEKPKRKVVMTGLIQRFSPADIEARISALEALGKFGEGLAALSGSDVADRAAQSVDDIGTEVQSISKHVDEITGKKSSDFASYAGPVSTFAGIVTKYWLKAKQADAVEASIRESKDSVKNLIAAFKKELHKIQYSVLDLGAEQQLQYRIDYYNSAYVLHQSSVKEGNKLVDDEKRKAFLKETEACAAHLTAIRAVDPNDLIDSLDKAFTNLIDATEKQKDHPKDKKAAEENFKELTTSIGAFMQEAKRVSDAVKALRDETSKK